MKASFKFELRKDREDKDGRRVLGLRYTAKRKTTLISLNLSLHPSEWNERKKCSEVYCSEFCCYQ